MTSLCYVICKDNDFLNIFHNFWFHLTPIPMTPVNFEVKSITFVATNQLMLLTMFG